MGRSSLSVAVLFMMGVFASQLPAQENRTLPTVTAIGIPGIKKLIHDRNGRTLFLNVWATWCKPCLEEFPDIAKIEETYAGHSVEVVAISIDYPDEIETKILPFLASQKVHFRVYVSSIKKDEDLMNVLNPAWRGAVPATFVFDGRGKMRAFLQGQKSYETFKATVDSVMGVGLRSNVRGPRS